MNQGDRDTILKKFFFMLWGMATLVLLFCVILLVREMAREGHDPLAAFQQDPVPSETQQQTTSRKNPVLGARDIELYFASALGASLSPESHTIEFSDSTAENCRHAIERLIAGPRGQLTPILPETTRLRAVYLMKGGELVVDFSRELISEHMQFKSASLEALMVYGIVNTLTQPALRAKDDIAVRQVRILIEGALPQETFPAHMDLSEPLSGDTSWIDDAFLRSSRQTSPAQEHSLLAAAEHSHA